MMCSSYYKLRDIIVEQMEVLFWYIELNLKATFSPKRQ